MLDLSCLLRLTLLSSLVLPSAVVSSGCSAFGPPPPPPFSELLQPTTHQLDLPGGNRLQYVELGEAREHEDRPVVLFVHGSPGSWGSARSIMAQPGLADQARLISVDRPGWGGSRIQAVDQTSRRKRRQWLVEPSLERQAAALRQLLEERADGSPAIVVGHSLGAPIAGRLAMDSPKLVSGIVIVSGSIDPQLEKTTWYQRLARMKIFRWLVPEVLKAADDEIAPLAAELEAIASRWQELTMPVTVLQGEKDRLVPAANADFAERVITNAPLVVRRLPDRGHFLPWEEPELVAETVRQHIALLKR